MIIMGLFNVKMLDEKVAELLERLVVTLKVETARKRGAKNAG